MQYAPTLPAENLSGFRFFYPRNEIIVIFSGTRVGAYCIRPTNGHANGQMDGKMDGVLVRFYSGKGKMAGDSMDRHPRKDV